jgi:hypothetical protein
MQSASVVQARISASVGPEPDEQPRRSATLKENPAVARNTRSAAPRAQMRIILDMIRSFSR